jgi:uncharacterized membrane protein YbaN (DUF454 family)
MGKRITAYLCLALGLVGLALPLLPGIPLLIIGLASLGPEHPLRSLLARWIPRKTGRDS